MFTRACVLAAALAGVFLPSARAEEPKKETKPKPPTFKAPKGWEVLDAGEFATARFRVGEGETAVTMTLTGLNGDGGGLVANVNRWRAQVGLKELAEKDSLQALESIKVDGLAGHILDVTGPDVTGKITQRVVAVAVPRGEHTWFVRMSGPAVDIGEQKKVFDEFVKSIRFEK
jgi:hypothetical protein